MAIKTFLRMSGAVFSAALLIASAALATES
jgi:hypothetical protein